MADCEIPVEDFDMLYARMNERVQSEQRRLAYLGTIEVTPYCNLRCVHCYINRGQSDGRILTKTELYRIIDEIAEEGCIWLLLTGGEPLARPDFLDIYTYAKKKGIFTVVFTNGTLVTRELAEYFRDLPPRAVEITLYGATRTTYESITGVPGSYEKCLRGIELLLEHGIRLKLKTVLMTLNLHEYHQMKKMAEDYNAEFRFDANINSALDGSHDPLRYRVSPEEVVQLDADDPGRCSVLAEKYRDLRPMNPNDNVFLCGAGKNLFHIDSFGKLHMCTMARVPAYDLRQGSFRDGWRNFLQEARLRKLTRPSVCRSCEYRLACTVCAGWSQTEFGDAEEHPVEYLCQITRLRAGMFAGENTAVNTLAKGE